MIYCALPLLPYSNADQILYATYVCVCNSADTSWYYRIMSKTSLVVLDRVSKWYKSGAINIPVLKDISFSVNHGEMIAIMGPSGSGKSTLMHIIGLLDRPSSGSMVINKQDVNLSMPDATLAALRSKTIGFVFQSFNLLPRMTALSNVLVPTAYRNASRSAPTKRAKQLLHDLNLEHRMFHKPTTLSGGEKQRVAIARALINDPDLILADEPTGNLDSKSGRDVLTILKELNKKGKTVVIVTHDFDIAKQCRRVIKLLDGEIAHDSLT